jgi:hypothetical protein
MIEELIPVIGLYQALLLSGYNPQDIKHLEKNE